MVKKYTTKRQGFIDPHDLMKTRDFIIVVDFQDYSRANDLLLETSIIYVTIFQLIVVFVSLTSFTLSVEIVLCLFSSCFIDTYLYCFC